MKKLTNYKIKQIKKNINYFYSNATKNEIIQGKEWYINANNEANNIAKKYNLDVYKVAQVISALSPRNKWNQNLKDADKLCEAFILGLHPTDIKVCTFHSNKFKAFNILNNNINITNNSLKTFNFVNNIATLDKTKVTLDIWVLRACFNKSILINKAAIGRIAYKQIESIFINKSKDINMNGFELQAILWLTCQRLYKY